ncbi:MAG: hypothetical protein AAB932_01630 [Patescibacteria group bacterium]|mgnify:CR=1 FL=1
MIKTPYATRARVNITLPASTLKLVNQVAPRGDRSRLINEALQYYIESLGRKNMREMLKEGAQKRSARDAGLAAEWFHLEEEI